MTVRVNGSPDRHIKEIDTFGGSGGGVGGNVIVDNPQDVASLALASILGELSDILSELQGAININVLNTPGLTETELRTVVPDEEGVWDYAAGTSGTVNVPANGRVIGIAAAATSAGATVTIDGGDAIPIPFATGVVSFVDVAPRANVIAPVVDFFATASFLVEWLV